MWSTADFHRNSTVRGEVDSWVHCHSKEVPPYYAQNNDSSPDSGDPPDVPPYFTKKMFPPDCWDPPATSSHARKCVRAKKRFAPVTAGTHKLHLRTQRKCIRAKKTKTKRFAPPDCRDPPATSSHARKCLTVGTHLVEAYVALSFWSRTCTYLLVDAKRT